MDLIHRLKEAWKSDEADTPLGQAIARLRIPFELGDGKRWYYERIISFMSAVRQALAAIDDSVSPDLPPFMLEPAAVARFFRIPLEDLNWQGNSASQVAQMLTRIEDKLDAVIEQPACEPDYCSIKQAAKITGLSDSHMRRAIRSGELPASNAGTQFRPAWRIARKDLDDWLEKKKGGHSVPPRSKLKELVNRHLPDL